MKAQIIKFPNRFLPAIRRTEPCIIVVLPVVRIEREPVECPKVTELRRQSRRLREHFKANRPKFSGGTCSGGESFAG